MCNRATIEPCMKESERNGGYLDSIIIPIENFRLAGAALATGSGNVRASEELAAYSLKWMPTATTTDDVAATGHLPGWIMEDPKGDSFVCKVHVNALQYDYGATGTGGATLDADIKLQATLFIFNRAGELAYSSGAIAADAVLGVASVNGTLTGIKYQTFDFGADMTAAEKKAIQKGGWFALRLAPNESVGADVHVHAFSCCMDLMRHARCQADVTNPRT